MTIIRLTSAFTILRLINPLKSAAMLIVIGTIVIGSSVSAIAGDTPNPAQEKQATKMDSKEVNIQQQINAIHNVKVATLILDHPFSSYRGAVNEYDFRHHAGNCAYTVKDQMDIDRLIDILKNANIKMQDSADPDVRTGIFLTLENGMELRFVFGGAFPGERDFDGLFNDQAITANKSLQEDLYRWAAKMEGNKKKCLSITSPYKTK